MTYGEINRTTEEINTLLDKVEKMNSEGVKEIEVTESPGLPTNPDVILQMELVDNPEESLGTYTTEQLDAKFREIDSEMGDIAAVLDNVNGEVI